jgi:hypothetical protein
MKNKNKGLIPAAELRDTLEVDRSTLRRWVKRGKIAEEHYRYESTPGRGRPRLEIDPAGLPEGHRQTWVMAQIESGAWGQERDPDVAAAERDIKSSEWQNAAAYRQAEAERRSRLLRAVPEDLSVEEKEEALAAYAEEVPEEEQPRGVSYSSLRTYRNAWSGKDGGLGGMVGLLPKKSNRKGKSKIREEDYQRYRALYLTQERRTHRRCYALVRGAAVDEGRDMETFPCARTFENQRKQRENPDFVAFRREGPEAWYQKESPYMSLDYGDVAAGDVYVADHRQLDVFVRDEGQGKIGRPWLTCWMDMRSWKIVSYAVYVGHPNSDRIHLTFKHAVSDFGLPEAVYIDNGKDFRCLDFAGKPKRNRPSTPEVEEARSRAVLDALGVTPVFALPYNARAKPIERRFCMFIQRLETFLPAYAGSNTEERPEKTDERVPRGDVMPLAEFEEHFAWAVDHINGAEMHGKMHDGRSPDEVWQAEREEVRRVDGRQLAALCLRTARPRQIRRCELKVTALDEIYRAPWMEAQNGTKTYARYDPEDPSEVWVFRAEDSQFLGAARPKPKVARLAETEEERARLEEELAKQQGHRRRLEEQAEELEDDQPTLEEMKRWADAAQAEKTAEREVDGTAPSEEERRADRSTLIQSDEAQGWIDEAERQEEAGRAELPYDPGEPGDDDDADDLIIWPDQKDDS